MIRSLFFVALLFSLSTGSVLAQWAPERAAWSNLGKERWMKARMQVKKALRKDSLNLGAHYTLAWYYFSPGNPAYNLDSAAAETKWILSHLVKLPTREKEKAIRAPFDSVGLSRLKTYIDSAAFARAKQINTEQAYTTFISQFTTAAQLPRAIELQHETAFLTALKENTYQAFAGFINQYPTAGRRDEALARYEKLLFETKTKDKKVNSYSQFLKDHPNSPYKGEAERQVFELTTASGTESALQYFLDNHANNSYKKQALDYLFYIYKEKGKDFSNHLTDSLKVVHALNEKTWWPIWKNSAYSFIDDVGREFLANVTDSLDQLIVCEGLTSDVLLADGKAIARNGFLIAEQAEHITDLGFGFLEVKSRNGFLIVHKSGKKVLDRKASLVGHHFFFSNENEKGTLYTLSGRKIVAGPWQTAVAHGDIIALKTENGWKLVPAQTLGAIANGTSLLEAEEYDEVSLLDSMHLVVRKGVLRALLNTNLKPLLPWSEQEFLKKHGKLVVKSDNDMFLYEQSNTREKLIELNSQWVIRKMPAGYTVARNANRMIDVGTRYDSAYLMGPVVVALRNDTTLVIASESSQRYSGKVQVELLRAAGSEYVLVNAGITKEILSANGIKVFQLACDRIEYAGGQVFTVWRKEKKTLVNKNGQTIALTDFDALGNATEHHVAVLYRKKFGLIDGQQLQLVKPHYDRNLVVYNTQFLVAWRDGAYGFIDWQDKPLGKFEFEEVRFWNDTAALVKKDFRWRLYNIKSSMLLPEKISTYYSFQHTDNETVAIVEIDNYYGVVSSTRGTILEPTYTSIQNIGTAEKPFFVTDKYVEEAQIHVVIYYDGTGKQVRRMILEEPEFTKNWCADE